MSLALKLSLRPVSHWQWCLPLPTMSQVGIWRHVQKCSKIYSYKEVTEDPNASWASSSSCPSPTPRATSVNNGIARQQGTGDNDTSDNANIANIAITAPQQATNDRSPCQGLQAHALPCQSQCLSQSSKIEHRRKRDGSDGQN